MEIWTLISICVIYVVLAWVAATLDFGIGLGEENYVRICSLASRVREGYTGYTYFAMSG